MQKLLERETYTPTDTSLVRSPVTTTLNRDGSLSERGWKTSDNGLEGNPRQRTGGSKSKVYVLNGDGRPLMPCMPAKARHLLEAGKARAAKRMPFTIQLKWKCETGTQRIVLGVDSGAKRIGFSAVTDWEELISGTVVLDGMMKSRLDARRMYRRTRRSRLWHRKPRFLNRKIDKGWLPPSIERRYQAHLKLIERLKGLMPIAEVRVETGTFDIQRIENPDIQSEGYQRGESYGWANLRSYVFAREKYTCQLCSKSVRGKRAEIHHIISRSRGGTDKPDNLALLHEKCHKRLHKNGLGSKLKRNKQYREATFMNIISSRFARDIECTTIFGYETCCRRKELGLEKSHVNDAFVIVGGDNQERAIPATVKQVRRNNRKLQTNRKGHKPSIRRQRYKLQPNDLVLYSGIEHRIKGTHCYGTRIVLANKLSVAIKKAELICYGKGFQFATI